MEAIQAFSDMLALYPDDPDARLGRGRVLAWEKRYGNAESDLRLVTNRLPTYADAWSALGDLYPWSGPARILRQPLIRNGLSCALKIRSLILQGPKRTSLPD